MALENFTPQQNTELYKPIEVGASPYYNTNTGLSSTPVAQMPVYKAPTFSTGNESFSFDPNQYLPAIKQQAESIFKPQQAQLEALRQLQGSQAETARIVTKEDFAKKMQSDIEAINQRGAFFSGGSINKQQETNTAERRALGDITTQWSAANFANIAQQAGLSASQTEYISNQLSGAKGSAYDMFNTERSAFQNERSYQQQLKQYEDEKKYREKQLKAQGKSSKEAKKQADKEFKENKRRWEAEFAKSKSSGGGSGNSSKVFNTAQDFASNWSSNLSSPYERPGGREVIGQQLANRYGGNAQDYINKYFQPGWEEAYWSTPKATAQREP